MQLRSGRPDELDALTEVLNACVAGMLAQGIEQWDEVYPNRTVLAQDLDKRELFVAADPGGALMGLIVLNTYQDPEYADVPWTLLEEPIGVIHRVMVHPRFQGRGVARGLMVHAEQEAKARGFRTLRLDAFSQNPRALSLYPGLGYRHAGFVQLRKGRFLVYEKALGHTV